MAPYLMRRMAAAGLKASVLSRQPLNLPSGFSALQLDLAQARWVAPEGAVLVSLLPLWILTQHLPCFMGAQAIIAISSTSRYGKAGSEDPHERSVAAKLELAEDNLMRWGRECGVSITLLRPTLIYDGIHDKNITRIARLIRRFGVFPIASPGKGLRQPIHADDVAQAIIGTFGNTAVGDKALNIGGGEILPYHLMVERIFQALGRKPRLLTLPANLLGCSFQLASKLGILREKSFGFAVFQRMNEDLVFDCAEGLQLLGYTPREFNPQFEA